MGGILNVWDGPRIPDSLDKAIGFRTAGPDDIQRPIPDQQSKSDARVAVVYACITKRVKNHVGSGTFGSNNNARAVGHALRNRSDCGNLPSPPQLGFRRALKSCLAAEGSEVIVIAKAQRAIDKGPGCDFDGVIDEVDATAKGAAA
jgi:hypothetical protein